MRDFIKCTRLSGAGLTGRVSALALVTAAMAMPQVAMAQDEEAEAAPSQGTIVVTGSRIQRSTFNSPTPMTVIGADTINQLGQVNIGETIQTLPQNVATVSDTNVGLAANTAQVNIGAQIANLRGLNPRNGQRTLTLVDTKRYVPSTTGGGVDMNLIPSILVQSVETVTGGASAAYGTDALAGVVNVILDKNLDGLKAQLDYGQTFRSDGTSLHAALGYGTSFADGRGHAIIGIDYEDAGNVGDCVYVREWCAESPDAFFNGDYNKPGAPNYGLPAQIRGDNGAYTNYTLTGVLRGTRGGRVNDTQLRNITFTPDGSMALDFEQGNYTNDNGFFSRQGGDCTLDCSLWSEVELKPAIERMSVFGNVDYEVNDSLKASFQATYATRKSNVHGLSLGPSSGHPIRADNAFLAGVTYLDRTTGNQRLLSDLIDDTRTGVFPGGGGWEPGVGGSAATQGNSSQAPGVDNLPLFIGYHMAQTPGARNNTTTDLESYRVMAGLEGDFSFLGNNWNWDAYYQYGKTSQFLTVEGNRVNDFFAAAIDAVDEGMMRTMQQDINGNWIPGSGTPNGNIVCRGTLAGPGMNPVAGDFPNSSQPASWFQHWNLPYADGCKPLALIGSEQDPEAVAYVYRTATEDFNYQQHVAAFNLSGDVWDGWAGPISLAMGAEYRFETGSAVHNELPFGIPFPISAFGNDYSGDLKILEGYAETNIPLLRDLPLVNYLEFNGAFRRTEQTNKSGTTGESKNLGFNTWKVSGDWEVTDFLRLRATRSRDVRAASFVDLYYNLGKTDYGPPTGRVNNPWATGTITGVDDFIEQLYPPNFTLQPEVGNTLTLGGVFTPGGALDGLRVSVDYFNIKITDAIVVLTVQETVNACYQAELACDAIFRGLNGTGASFADLTPAERTAASTPILGNSGLIGGGIESIRRGNANVGKFKTSGYDIEVQYRLPLDKFGENIPGTVTARGLATLNSHMTVDLLGTGTTATDWVNQTGGTGFGGFAAPPKYILTGYLTYDLGGFSITGDWKYIPEGVWDIRRCDVSRGECAPTDVNSVNDNYVDSKLYTNLSTSYEFGLKGDSTAEVFFTIRNLFDVRPSKAPSNASGAGGPVLGNGGPTNPVYFDTLGARWRAGVRLNF